MSRTKERGDGGGSEHKSEREEDVDRRVSRTDDSHYAELRSITNDECSFHQSDDGETQAFSTRKPMLRSGWRSR